MLKPGRDYAAPLLAMDCVVRLDGNGITTRKAIDGNEPFFAGHYPGQPIYPGVFIVEAVEQAVRQYASAHGQRARLEEVRSTRFQQPLQPGDVLEAECECRPEPAAARLEVKATCRSGRGQVAQLKLSFAMEDKHDHESRAN